MNEELKEEIIFTIEIICLSISLFVASNLIFASLPNENTNMNISNYSENQAYYFNPEITNITINKEYCEEVTCPQTNRNIITLQICYSCKEKELNQNE